MYNAKTKYIHDITQYTMIISLVNYIDYITATFLGEEVQLVYQTRKTNGKHCYENT